MPFDVDVLFQHIIGERLSAARAHLLSLSAEGAAPQIFFQDEHGDTALMWCCYHDVHLSLIELMVERGWEDPARRNIAAVADYDGALPLHCAASDSDVVGVHKLLIREYPRALIATGNHNGETPLKHAQIYSTHRSNYAAILALYEDATAAHGRQDYRGLIALCGPSPILLALRFKTRATLVLCLDAITAASNAKGGEGVVAALASAAAPPPQTAPRFLDARQAYMNFLIGGRDPWLHHVVQFL